MSVLLPIVLSDKEAAQRPSVEYFYHPLQGKSQLETFSKD